MDLQANRKANIWLPILFISFLLLAFTTSCKDNATDPPPPPPPMTLDISPTNGIFEVDTGVNFYISGSLVDQNQNPLSGRTVHFSVSPQGQGEITPYATLDPTKNNGFQTQVVYNSDVNGIYLITGQVRGIDDVVTAQDTMSVTVRPPINQ